MTTIKDLIAISKVPGVDQFIFVNGKGSITAHNIKNPENAAKIVLTCGKNSSAISKTDFKYLIFSRKNKKNFLIFPVGKYYLGVIKQSSISDNTLGENIISFLKKLLKKNKVQA